MAASFVNCCIYYIYINKNKDKWNNDNVDNIDEEQISNTEDNAACIQDNKKI